MVSIIKNAEDIEEYHNYSSRNSIRCLSILKTFTTTPSNHMLTLKYAMGIWNKENKVNIRFNFVNKNESQWIMDKLIDH